MSKLLFLILLFTSSALAQDQYFEISRKNYSDIAMLSIYAQIKKVIKELCVEKGYSGYRITKIEYIKETDRIHYKCIKR